MSISGLDTGLYGAFYCAPSSALVSPGSFTVNGVSQAAVDNPQGHTTAPVLGATHGLATGILVNQGVMTFQSASTLSYRGLDGLQPMSAKSVPVPGTQGLVAVAFAGLLGWGAALRKRVVWSLRRGLPPQRPRSACVSRAQGISRCSARGRSVIRAAL